MGNIFLNFVTILCGRQSARSVAKPAVCLIAGIILAAGSPTQVAAFDIFGGAEALLREGQDMLEQGKLLEARQLLEQAIQKDPQNAEAYATLGTCLERQEAPRLAEQAYKQAIKLDPQNKPALNNLATLYWVRMKRYPESVELLKKVIELDPQSKEAYVSLGAAYNFWAANDKSLSEQQKAATYQEAIKAFQEAIHIDPDFAKAHANLGQCYLFMGRAADAERELQKALNLEPTYAFAHFNLAELYEAQDKLQQAMQHYRASYENEQYESNRLATMRHIERVELKMGTAKLLSVANVKMSQGKWAEAADAFANAMSDPRSTAPRSPVAWNNYGYVLARLGKHTEAVQKFGKATAMKPPLPAAYYNLGHSLLMLGDKAGAERAFNAAVRAGGGQHALAHNSLGILLKDRGKCAEACHEYKLAIMQSGDELHVIHYNWGLCYEKMGKPDKALHHYRVYLNTASPASPNRPRVQARADKLNAQGVKLTPSSAQDD
ncbi:MAG: tetratricopeptide repeat protein [Candidatus Obscuribacterales bacterium]